MNFIEIYFNGILKQSLPVKADIINIGRASSNDIIIENMGVSNHHALISKKNNIFSLEDLNSTNGTFLNGQKISARQRISSQDSIIIGKHTLKFSEWSQSKDSTPAFSLHESDDATIMMGENKNLTSQSSVPDTKQNINYLLVRGELKGINKLLLSESIYGIGKAKDNKIRLGGWITPAYIAEIKKIDHSFYINPFKKNKVKLNNSFINSSTALSPSDEIRIKNLVLKFIAD